MPDALLPAAKANPKGADLFFLVGFCKTGFRVKRQQDFGGDSGAVQGRLEFPQV